MALSNQERQLRKRDRARACAPVPDSRDAMIAHLTTALAARERQLADALELARELTSIVSQTVSNRVDTNATRVDTKATRSDTKATRRDTNAPLALAGARTLDLGSLSLSLDKDSERERDTEGEKTPLASLAAPPTRKRHEATRSDTKGDTAVTEAVTVPATTRHDAGKKTPAKGSRIPADWRPSDALQAWGDDQDVDVMACAANFVDYWTAKAGPTASKLDWDAAFRNWVRSDKQRGTAPKSWKLRQAAPPKTWPNPGSDGPPLPDGPEKDAYMSIIRAGYSKILRKPIAPDATFLDLCGGVMPLGDQG